MPLLSEQLKLQVFGELGEIDRRERRMIKKFSMYIYIFIIYDMYDIDTYIFIYWCIYILIGTQLLKRS